MNKKNYFFCYSHTLHKFIHNKHNIKYICAALNEHDSTKKFWLYEKDDKLEKALIEYDSLFKSI